MPATIVTPEDLQSLKQELLEEIGKMLAQHGAMPAKKWLKSHEVRKMLAISPGTLQNLRINGTLPFTKIGGVMFYDYEDVRKMLEDHKHVSYTNSFHR
ncbi:MAG: helix-turn-helix domain-containing protein [Cyclobacteriaceae bacterium]|nr:helix-turn-helix domain-containing protein [Cyclobacteriaceae bacterium]